MIINKKTAELIYEMEYIVGKECFNPKSYDGYTGVEGKEYRYPVLMNLTKKDTEPYKFRRKIGPNVLCEKIDYKMIPTMKYKFGANQLFIGNALVNILQMLEERYGLDFNELERSRKKTQNK